MSEKFVSKRNLKFLLYEVFDATSLLRRPYYEEYNGKMFDMVSAAATLYLEFFAVISIAWQWLLQGIYVQKGLKNNPTDSETDFLQGKFCTLRFFFAYELPKTKGLEDRLTNTDGLTVEMETDHFSD